MRPITPTALRNDEPDNCFGASGTRDAGPLYRTVGNGLPNHLMGADLYVDETERPIEDQGPLTEGVIADPDYEGRAIRGLLNLAAAGRFEKDAKILPMHLGGSPAIHGYAGQFEPVQLQPLIVSVV